MTSKQAIIASIVLYKNDPEEVASAIGSVLSAPMEVACTVVDNSPVADLRAPVVDSGASYLFAGENRGFGAAHNLVLRQCMDKAEYLLVMNPDIRFGPEVLPALHEFMNRNPEVGLVMPRILYPDGSDQGLCKRLPSPGDLLIRRFLGRFGGSLFSRRLEDYELRHLDLSVSREIPSLSGCFMFIRSEALRTVGVFDERFFMYMEDVDLCRRIGHHYRTVFFPAVSVIHGYAKGSYRSFKLLRHHVGSAIRYFSKWGWFKDLDREKLNSRVDVYRSSRSSQK
jgi:GT2 family glycosyltransferase